MLNPNKDIALKINKIQRYDSYQIKKKSFQAILVNFHQFSDITYDS